MRYEPTPGLIRALARAAVWARHLNESEVQLEHLLRGLTEDEESQPSTLLTQAGLRRDGLTSIFFADPPPDLADEGEGEGENVTQADRVRDILHQAQDLARAHFEEATLTSDHVLLALLNADGDLRDRLESIGLNFALLKETIDPLRPVIPMPEPLNLFEPPEDVDAARVLDASANRAREALRVLEDHTRFILNDALLSGQLKQLRHDLAGLMDAFPQRLLLESRDTLHDVGTTLSTARERERASISEVVQANAKRLQEALRTLEEFSKIFSAELGQAFEKIRYQSYTIERALLLGGQARDRLANAHLYVLLTEAMCRFSLLGTLSEAIAGGAQIIQLREKNRPDGDLLKLAREVRRMTRAAGVLFIVNDRPDIARLAEADGVHLGQEDMPLREARRIVGADALIGVSTHNLEQVRRAVLEGAGYIGVGPTFPSRTKDFVEFPGLEFVAQALAETSLPAFALGGVNLQTLPALTAIGCRRVAVSHAICAAEDPRLAAAQMRGILGS
jgi:thiamine-phosphate pyrophosphorylase